jgi:hypothetical protein
MQGALQAADTEAASVAATWVVAAATAVVVTGKFNSNQGGRGLVCFGSRAFSSSRPTSETTNRRGIAYRAFIAPR